jgi:ABC-2 type transport system ATP-binding protein
MILEVEGLCKTFRDKLTLKKKQVLFDVSFSIPNKSITGFLGSNGAGKTTTMKCVLDLLRPDKGQIRFFDGQYKDPRYYIGYLPERPYFYEYLTGIEFLVFYGQLSMNLSRVEIRKEAIKLLERVGLGYAQNKLLRSFSKGMLQRVGLAQAIIHTPKFLILDEPMSGLDPDGRFQITQLIKEVGESGATIFFSSHLLDDVEKLCDRLVIINNGKIIFEGLKKEFLKSTSEGGYDVSYYKEGDRHLYSQRLTNLALVTQFLSDLEKSGGVLVSVQEPRLSIEEAFNRVKQESVAQ